MKKIRILLADDHTIVRMGLLSLLSCERDMAVVGEAENGQEAVRLARELRPDVVIMDLMMPLLSGAEATRLIRGENPSANVVVLTSFGQSAELAAAVRNGAAATLLKGADPKDLIDALRAVCAGRQVIPKNVRELVDSLAETAPLTDRQTDILNAVSRGLSNLDIARVLGISEDGVKKHIQSICQKLGASNRAEAAAIAVRKMLLKP